jgi:hypothetical protein
LCRPVLLNLITQKDLLGSPVRRKLPLQQLKGIRKPRVADAQMVVGVPIIRCRRAIYGKTLSVNYLYGWPSRSWKTRVGHSAVGSNTTTWLRAGCTPIKRTICHSSDTQ